MNSVCLIGNVASDTELRHTSGGRPVCEFRIAISRGGSDTADFFTIIAWDRQAEVCHEYLGKGRKVGIEGRLQHSTWEAQDGAKRSKVEVIAHRVELLSPASRDDEAAPAAAAADEDYPF